MKLYCLDFPQQYFSSKLQNVISIIVNIGSCKKLKQEMRLKAFSLSKHMQDQT